MSQPVRKTFRKYLYKGDPLSGPLPPELAAIIDRHRGKADALITVLEEIQAHYGYLPQRQLQYVTRELGFPLARIYGVATFYNLFRVSPPGRYTIRICRGTACHVNGSGAILAHLKEKLGIGEDETTPDGLFSLQTVACIGACSLAPAVVINEQTHGRMTPETTWDLLCQLKAEAEQEVEVAR